MNKLLPFVVALVIIAPCFFVRAEDEFKDSSCECGLDKNNEKDLKPVSCDCLSKEEVKIPRERSEDCGCRKNRTYNMETGEDEGGKRASDCGCRGQNSRKTDNHGKHRNRSSLKEQTKGCDCDEIKGNNEDCPCRRSNRTHSDEVDEDVVQQHRTRERNSDCGCRGRNDNGKHQRKSVGEDQEMNHEQNQCSCKGRAKEAYEQTHVKNLHVDKDHVKGPFKQCHHRNNEQTHDNHRRVRRGVDHKDTHAKQCPHHSKEDFSRQEKRGRNIRSSSFEETSRSGGTNKADQGNEGWRHEYRSNGFSGHW
ncbi:hypothetical protein ACFFRR_004501 [Megaselia abdita]